MKMLVEIIVVIGAALLWWRLLSFDHVKVCYNVEENSIIKNSSNICSNSDISRGSSSSNSSNSSGTTVRRLVDRLEILRKPYYFPIWCFDGNIHSFYGNWIRQGPQQKYSREDLIATDGQVISLDWTTDDLPDDAPLVFLLPGINGGSSNEYAKYFVKYFREEGWRVAVYNRPGSRGTRLVSSRIIQFPDSDYVSMLFNHVMQRYPRAPILALGISLGGNSLLRFLGQKGDQLHGRVLGAISLSNPFDFLGAMKRIRRVKFYDNWLCRKAVSLIKENAEVMRRDESLDLEEIFKVSSTEDFDKAYTMKILSISDLHGLEEMYQRNSCLNYLHNIRVPTLIANALDDPLVGDSFMSEVSQHAKTNRNLVLATTKHGGHGCWFEGFVFPSGKTWMDRLSVEFIRAVLELQSHNTPSN